MIQFSGDMSEECKRYIVKREIKSDRIAITIAGIPFTLFFVVLGITCYWPLGFGGIAFLIAFLCAGVGRNNKSDYRNLIPLQVTIKRGVATTKVANFEARAPLEYVKKVVDMGGWYRIFFRMPYRCPRFVCEKRLLVSGTIEEFENLFDGKIIRIDTTKKKYPYFY